MGTSCCCESCFVRIALCRFWLFCSPFCLLQSFPLTPLSEARPDYAQEVFPKQVFACSRSLHSLRSCYLLAYCPYGPCFLPHWCRLACHGCSRFHHVLRWSGLQVFRYCTMVSCRSMGFVHVDFLYPYWPYAPMAVWRMYVRYCPLSCPVRRGYCP